MKDFELKKDKWLKEVAEQCHEYAIKTDLDFYAFQTPIFQNPEILIIGINPGNSGKYTNYLQENNIDRRKPESLYYSQNLLIEEAKEWSDGMRQVRRKFREIFFTDLLFSKLQNSVMTNMIFFNTQSTKDLKNLNIEIEEYCIGKTLELIEILQPKNILIFSSNTSLLKKIGIEDLQQKGDYTKVGLLNKRNVCAIPHFSARGYNTEKIRNKIGEEIIKYLK